MKILKKFEFFNNANRRSITNVLIDKNAQLRFLIPFLMLFLTGVAAILILSFTVSNSLSQLLAEEISTNPKIAADIQIVIQNMHLCAVVGMSLLALLSLLFWVVYSHRIFGANYAIEKQIRKLQDEGHCEPLRLRKYDEFVSTAKALNDLAEKIRQKN